MSVWVSARTFDNYAKQLERKMLKTHARSLTFSSIARGVSILEYRDGDLLVEDNWREQMYRCAVEGVRS